VILLRLRGRKVGFGLADLIRNLSLLVAKGCRALGHLRGRGCRTGAVIRLFLLELAGVEHGNHLTGFHLIALVDVQLLDASGNLWADHHIVGRDDAGENEGHRTRGGPPVVGTAGDQNQEDQRTN